MKNNNKLCIFISITDKKLLIFLDTNSEGGVLNRLKKAIFGD